MHTIDAFLQDMSVIMLIAGAITIFFHMMKQPVVLGYIVAGVIVGPNTPIKFIHDMHTVHTLGEVGVVFLMFALGLEFSLRKLKQVGLSALVAASLEIIVMFWIGFQIGSAFGWKFMDALFLGAMLSISSTTIIVKALGELGKTRDQFAQIIFGILILEDILAIVMLALLSGMIIPVPKPRTAAAPPPAAVVSSDHAPAAANAPASPPSASDAETAQPALDELAEDEALTPAEAKAAAVERSTNPADHLALDPWSIVITLAKLSAFLAFVLIFGLILVPRLFDYIARFQSNEVTLVTALGLCFGVSLLAIELQYSVALGAFMIGAVIAESRQIAKIETLTEPLKDMFSAVFFTTIGMAIDPQKLMQYWFPILIISLAVIGGKVVATSFGAFVAGNDRKTSLRVGMGLAQIGEFSFIIATLGLNRGVTSEFLYPVAVAVSVITTLTTPYLIGSSDHLVNIFEKLVPNKILRSLEVYTTWVGNLANSPGNPAFIVMRSMAMQVGINFALTLALFGIAAYMGQSRSQIFPAILRDNGLVEMTLWLGAMLVTLPLYLSSFNKLQGIARLLAFTAINHDSAGAHAPTLQGIVTNIFMTLSLIVMVVLTILLSSTILPSLSFVIVALLIVMSAAWLLRKPMTKAYVVGQKSLEATFARPPAPRHHEERKLPDLMDEVELDTVEIFAQSPAANKTLGELRLRTETGVTVVGIERAGRRMVNPLPSVVFLPGDKVLLLGERDQLEPARFMFRAA